METAPATLGVGRPSWEGAMPTVVVGVLTFVGIAAYYHAAGFTVVRSDTLGYLQWSHAWWSVESIAHVPGYPFVLWLLRTLTFGALDGGPLMQLVTLASWI